MFGRRGKKNDLPESMSKNDQMGELTGPMKLFYLIPDTVYFHKDFEELFDTVSSIDSEFRYDREDEKLNCVYLPTKPDRALVLGVALYSDTHPSYDEFVIARLKELEDKGMQVYLAAEKKFLQTDRSEAAEKKAEEAAALYVAQALRGFINFLRHALQVNGIKEAEPSHRPLLVLSDNDPHLAA